MHTNVITTTLVYFLVIASLAIVDVWVYRLMCRSVILRDKRKTRCNAIGRNFHIWISSISVILLLLVAFTVPDSMTDVVGEWLLRLVVFSVAVLGVLSVPAITMILCEIFALKKNKGKCLTWMYHQPFFDFFRVILIYIVLSWGLNVVGISCLMNCMTLLTA